MDDLENNLIYGIMKDSACEGKTETLQRLLDEGFDVNHEYPDGSTLLHYASRNKQKEVIRILLQNGVDYDKCDKEGNTAIHIGVFQCDMEIWKSILIFRPYNENLKKDMTLNHVNQFFEFFKDIKENKSEVINKLSELENDDLEVILNTRNKEGNSLLLIAFDNEHKEIAYQLMDLVTKSEISSFQLDHLEKIKTGLSEMVGGFDLIGFNVVENKYFSIISDNNNLNILTAFLTAIDKQLQDCYADLLLEACKENNLENVETLIKRARGNLKKNICKEGLPGPINDALTKESQLGNSNFGKLKLIVNDFASWYVLRRRVINTATEDGTTPLKIAVNNDNLNIVKILLRYGAYLTASITAPPGHACHDFLNDMHEYFKSEGANIHKFDSEADKVVLTNQSRPVWFKYIGKPDNETKLKLLDLCEVDEEIMLQKFIL